MEVIPTTNFQPDISISGLRLGEPVIGLTGLFVTLICFYAWYRLGKTGLKDDAFRLSRTFFLLTGFSTLIGAIVGHLFLYCLPFEFKIPGWVLSMIGVSALEQASIVRSKPFLGAGWYRALSWLNILELTFALWFVTATLWFPGVEIHTAFGLLCMVAPLEAVQYFKTRSEGSKNFFWGILCLVGGVLMHILKISPSVWFCYFDLAHLWMVAAIWFFLIGVEKHGSAPVA